MFKVDFVTLFASFGTFQGVFFSLLIWLRQGKVLYNRIFALFLLVTSIRIAKNIVVHASDIDPNFTMSQDLWRFLVNFGITHQFAVGPLFFLYFASRLRVDFHFNRTMLWHFLPYLLLVASSAWLPWPFWQKGGLWASYISILVYYLLAFRIYYMAKSGRAADSDPELYRWMISLLAVAGVLMVAYSPALFKYIGYIGGSFLYAIGLYGVSVMVLTRGQPYPWFKSKYNGSGPNQATRNKVITSLENLMKAEQIFANHQLSLASVAKRLDISTHLLSQIINAHYQKSFSDYVNGYRIEAAKEMLRDPALENVKIAAVAYDCGFAALSTFNTIFKKHSGATPSDYRKAKGKK